MFQRACTARVWKKPHPQFDREISRSSYVLQQDERAEDAEAASLPLWATSIDVDARLTPPDPPAKQRPDRTRQVVLRAALRHDRLPRKSDRPADRSCLVLGTLNLAFPGLPPEASKCRRKRGNSTPPPRLPSTRLQERGRGCGATRRCRPTPPRRVRARVGQAGRGVTTCFWCVGRGPRLAGVFPRCPKRMIR